MRKTIPVLFGLGGFLLIAGFVALLWAPGVVKKTPLDVNSTTHLSGQAEKLNVATGELEANPSRRPASRRATPRCPTTRSSSSRTAPAWSSTRTTSRTV